MPFIFIKLRISFVMWLFNHAMFFKMFFFCFVFLLHSVYSHLSLNNLNYRSGF